MEYLTTGDGKVFVRVHYKNGTIEDVFNTDRIVYSRED